MYCLNMLALPSSCQQGSPYEDMASKFFEHSCISPRPWATWPQGIGLWNEEDGFFYDVLHTPDGVFPMKVRSLVGLVRSSPCRC